MAHRTLRTVVALLLIASGFALFTDGAAATHIDCGDVITADAVLDSDLGPCNDDPVLTVEGATLDLDGHSVTGGNFGGQACIELATAASIVENGEVSACDVGIELSDVDGHIVRYLRAEENLSNGFLAASGSSHVIHHTTALANGGDGYRVVSPSANNLFFRNTADRNAADGFDMREDGSQLFNNLAIANGGTGYFLEDDGGGTLLAKNTASKNQFEGFGIQSDGNTILLNTSTKNGAQGFYVDSNDNIIGGNKAPKNAAEGIHVDSTASGNSILSNTASENGGDDLRDSTFAGACVGNDWDANKGETDDPCTQKFVPPAPTLVEPVCGDVLGAGSYFLKKNLGPCGSSPVLTLSSGADLDMRGNVIKGDGNSGQCINVTGTGSVLQNGSVSGCADGVTLAGTGAHLVRKVKAKNVTEDGFDVPSSDNILHSNSASGNEGHSFFIEGNGNIMFRNKAKNDVGAAFDLIEDQNTLWSNASKKSLRGFVLDEGATSNLLVANKAKGAREQGIDIRGDDNDLFLNSSKENRGDGFDVRSSPAPGANENILGGNKAIENDRGIVLSGADGNTAVGNTSKRNRLDMRDPVDACFTNLWEGNVFKTKDPSCIS